MPRRRLLDLDFSPGDESLEVELMDEQAIPWEQMAFPTIEEMSANWLPMPAEPFELTLRMYGPREAIFAGAWAPPRPVLLHAGECA